jgi:hypothetical protein
MRRSGRQRSVVSAILLLVPFAATACGTTAPGAAGPVACTAPMIHATLGPPGAYRSASATSYYLYQTQSAEFTNTSARSCYLAHPTLIDVSVPAGRENIADLSLAPARVNVPPAASIALRFGSLVGCSTFQPPIWTSAVTVTFPHVGSLRLGGLHLDLLCGPPQLLSYALH